MYNRFKTVFLLLPVILLLLAFPDALRSAQMVSAPAFEQAAGGSDLTVTQTSSSALNLSWVWNQLSQPTTYNVTITDMTTHTVIYTGTATSRYATITGLTLTAGHVIRCSVDSLGYFIIMDTTMV